MYKSMFLGALVALMAGCTCPECPAEKECPTPAVEPDWTALYTALNSQIADAPVQAGTNTQVGQGEFGLIGIDTNATPPADIPFGAIHATAPTTAGQPYLERWVSSDPEALRLLPPPSGNPLNLDFRFVPNPPEGGQLTPTRIATYCAQPNAASLQLATMVVNYYGFPGAPAIAALPATNPPGTTSTATYEVYTNQLGTPTRTGTLYRELAGTNPVTWKDFWTFEDDYVLAGAGVITQVRPSGTPFTTLKGYLEAMQTLRNASANPNAWRYAPIPYTWSKLCP